MQALELFKGHQVILTTDTVNDKGTRSSIISISKPKDVALAFGLSIKSGDIAINLQQAGESIKTQLVKEVGSQAVDPSVFGVRMKRTVKKSGEERYVYTLVKPVSKNASESAIAAYLGLTVEQVRELRAKQSAPAKPIDVQATVTPNGNAPTSVANQVPIAQKPVESPVEATA